MRSLSQKNKINRSLVDATCKEFGIPAPVYECPFHPIRKWRFDLAWPLKQLAVEVQGGIFSGGRHVRGSDMLLEYDKLNTAASLGWRVMFVTPSGLCKSDFMKLLARAYESQNVS